MQKHRVFCPHCSVSLLVTEDLFGTVANCPGCHGDFLLPGSPSGMAMPLESASAPLPPIRETFPNIPKPGVKESGIPPHFSLQVPEHDIKAVQKEVKIETRPGLRLVANLLKVLAGLQVVAGCLILLVMLAVSLRKHPGTEAILLAIVAGLAMGLSAIPTLALSELILVFISQDEMLRHIVNQLRSRD